MKTEILIQDNAWQALSSIWKPSWTHAAIIGDSTVMGLFGAQLQTILDGLGVHSLTLDFPPGEASKTRRTKEALEDRLLEQHFPRHGVILGLGGGISTDLAGFVAATYLRGVDVILLPTSLLAQVDAALGGKTGVNTPHGKNLVGAFHQPTAVLIDPSLTRSLPVEEVRNGWAEMVKTAVLGDAVLFEKMEQFTQSPTKLLPDLDLVARCAKIKQDIVQQDATEKGIRAVLNFGHSIGHAVEAHSRYRLRHGEAVAIGMVVEGLLAQQYCNFPVSDQQRMEALLKRLGLPTQCPYRLDELWPYLLIDKKNQNQHLRVVLPARIGTMHNMEGQFTLPISKQIISMVFDQFSRS